MHDSEQALAHMRRCDALLDRIAYDIDAARTEGNHYEAGELALQHDDVMRARRNWAAVFEGQT